MSWEYASILDLWRAGAEKAGSVEPTEVLPAMKAGGKGLHAFGEAEWWGRELFGIDNALVGDWPVVAIENGKAMIKEFKSVPRLVAQARQAAGQAFRQDGRDVLPARIASLPGPARARFAPARDTIHRPGGTS